MVTLFKLIVSTVGIVNAFHSANNSYRTFRPITKSSVFGKVSDESITSTCLNAKHTLVLIRHGESTWNDANLFTGWADCPLSEKGVDEAMDGGKLLKDLGYKFDVAYTSTLKRAIKTLWIVLEEMDLMYLPIVNSWRLNERHYGALQGLNKQETVDKYGKDQVLVWRRSYDIPPPELDESSEHYPGNDARYVNVDKTDLPLSESLKLTEARFLVMWNKVLAPEIKSGKKILIAAHGNTLRALVKHLDGISEDAITGLNIPTGIPLVYELDDDLKPIPHKDAIEPLNGLYLGNLDEVKERIGAVVAQTK